MKKSNLSRGLFLFLLPLLFEFLFTERAFSHRANGKRFELLLSDLLQRKQTL